MKRRIDRQDILNTGLEIMFSKGYSATGIKEITDSISIPKGSFYNHFDSKESFGLEMVERYCDNGIEFHKTNLLDSELSPLNRLKTHYSKMIDFSLGVQKCKNGCIMSNFSQELGDVNESFRVLLDSKFLEIESIIAQCIEQGQDIGEINTEIDSKATAAFILNSWHGALMRMKASASIKPLNDFFNLVFNNIL
ncbi:TetR family transcriptional regulator C-terminal domain-containing protein [Winogradskyella sp. 3972H.M.0a.05]|uniref:TetR/AcrR family transcriptional regulator n=1 Tax=Winogradskyella sp. 3972H.M.0a.05 TaxID=2950277 RepID=UPI003395B32A